MFPIENGQRPRAAADRPGEGAAARIIRGIRTRGEAKRRPAGNPTALPLAQGAAARRILEELSAHPDDE